MTPPAKIQEEGLVAYEQVRAFEQLRRRRLPLIYAVIPLLLVGCGMALLAAGHGDAAVICLGIAILMGTLSWFNWHSLKKRYARNLERLAEIESEYGEKLPWLEVERHLAALEQLKSTLAEERASDQRAGQPAQQIPNAFPGQEKRIAEDE